MDVRKGIMTADKSDRGLWGEELAARALKKAGYRILGERVRLSPRDEIDIVARKGEVVAFVEVKTRASDRFGRPAEHVDRAKRRTQSRAAVRYLKRLKYPNVYVRFDIVEVLGEPGGEKPEIRHLENAFPLEAPYRLPVRPGRSQ